MAQALSTGCTRTRASRSIAADKRSAMRYRSGMRVQTKMDQNAGGHQWPFDGSKCLACGMAPTRYADTKKPCPGPQPERERFTVPDDDDDDE
jgi:hypothetical protein